MAFVPAYVLPYIHYNINEGSTTKSEAEEEGNLAFFLLMHPSS
jgi:hypothetical protein